MRSRIWRLCAMSALVSMLALTAAGSVAAHTVQQVGPYTVTIGWLREPTYVGEQNAVQFLIHDASAHPVDGLSTDNLSLVVSTGSTRSDPLDFAPSFDEDTGLGLPGEYLAPIIPTAPGGYTFHLTGKIRDQPVDLTVSSGVSTFDSVISPTGIQFPVPLPALGDMVTRLDRVDSRIGTAQGAASDASDKAEAARSAASQAMVIGLLAGGVGTLAGIFALVVAIRRRPPSAG
jgi:hypothetical protein